MMKRFLPLAAALLAGAASIAAAPSKSAHPDFTGVWMIQNAPTSLKTVEGKEPPLTPAGRAIYEANKAKTAKGDKSWDGFTYCLPPGLPRLFLVNKPFEILQKPKEVYFVHQENRLPRRVYLNEQFPDDLDTYYQGYSIGKWVGPELVVESKGFREGDTFIDFAGLPHTKDLHLTERWKMSADGKTLTARFTIEDPKDYSRPWTAQVSYVKRPGYHIPEDVCAERLKTTSPSARGK